ncbi:MAG: peptidoglycan-binding protein [Patescibacteria group bacterium]|nr:peptidoglycan-binding protein [Patescibacteria group bacterium]
MKTRIVLSGLTALAMTLVVAGTASAATLTNQLDIGSQGSDVIALQQYLAQYPNIYPQGLVTGYYGSLTAQAVANWQQANGLPSVGRVGPLTLAALNTAMASFVSTDNLTSTGSLSLANVSAPVMSPEAVATTSTSATISWTTDKPAHDRVMYGTVWPFLYATAPSTSNPSFGTTANVTITGLQPNTLYYYVRESVDAFGNVQWTVVHTFTTAS